MLTTRRQAIRAGLGAGTGLFLAACGAGARQAPTAQGAGEAPRPGGTLRIGALGKPGAVTRDPHGTQVNESDYLIIALVYDALTVPGAQPTVAPGLAVSWESDDLRRWHFKIAENATFHDGRPVTSEDVVWSLRRLRSTPSGAARLPGVEADAIKADGAHGVTLTGSYPNNELPLLLRLTTFTLPKDTRDPAGAPGTGPFKLRSFQDGNAGLVRNDSWHGGKPLLDGIEVRIFQSAQAMTNALLTGQIDLASNAGPLAARTAQGRPGVQVVRRRHDLAMPIVMRTAGGPFADERVRLALRLAVDRQALVRQALSGYGVVANDVLGTADPAYAKDLPQRTRDLTRARSLLTVTGFDLNATYDLCTTEDVPGLAESATLFAGQVREAGVKVRVVKQDPAVFWDQTWLKAPLYTTYWGTNDSVVFFAGKTMLSGTGQNETGFDDPEFDRAYRRAVSAKDTAERTRLLGEVQRIQYERSGYLLWGMADGIDLAAAHVRDLPTLPGYGRVRLERAWLAT
ncbi:ABC transporter substrate-binding protein [Nonomuraea jiangxiensis]|uniref:Peptide/nickel transport system substrate-binding protein n=1 Tax=Nonomuraea jiangxiensis TaxID=633440 RepID=A0A1G9BZD1_9ACTN|nr:ABC transporter substrate-binding protein [Nonomuraea jiangxiensis]SDK44275.1 peptide/nickel transport system substrate-binding protein [Nonomuraea jiangxiensis]